METKTKKQKLETEQSIYKNVKSTHSHILET